MGRAGIHISLGICLLLTIIFLSIIQLPNIPIDLKMNRIHASNDHPNIHFDSDSDVVNFPNKTGTGTREDPYIIRDLVIDAEGVGFPVVLFNIEVFLILENITVLNGQKEGPLYGFYGIDIDQCSNIAVNGCKILDNYCGINLNQVFDCNVTQNYIQGNEIGVSISFASNIIISSNEILDNNMGIQSVSTFTPCYIRNNTLVNNTEGIFLEGGNQETEVNHNYVTQSNKGIVVSAHPLSGIDGNNLVYENIVHENSIGIEMVGTDANFISENTISYNTLGIKLEESNQNVFLNNHFIKNGRNLQKFNSKGNGLIVLKTWEFILIWVSAGILALSCTVLGIIFSPKRRFKVKLKKKLNEGEILKSQDKYEEAISCFDEVLKEDPSNESATNRKIAILYELKRYDEISQMLRHNESNKEETK